jgi:hypothetical protein
MDKNTGGSLPWAITKANASLDVPNTIKFDPSLTSIAVTSTLPPLTRAINVDGLKGRTTRMKLIGPGTITTPFTALEVNSDFGVGITNLEIVDFTQPIKVASFLASSGMTITNNLIHDNLGNAIVSSAAGKHLITNNAIYANNGIGLSLSFSSTTTQQSTISNNQIGVSGGNGGDGIYLGPNVSNVDVNTNSIVNNGNSSTNDGISIDPSAKSSIRISNNAFAGNNDLPIDLKGDGPTANDLNDSDSGPNNLLNYPVIDPRTIKRTGANWSVNLSLDAYSLQDAGKAFRFEVYSYDPSTVGYSFLGSNTAVLNGSGDTSTAGVTVTVPFGNGAAQLPAGGHVVALAMRNDAVATSYTSEFSQPISVLPAITSVKIKSSLGGPTHDFDALAGKQAQLQTVPIGAADTVVIGFNQPVTINSSHVSIVGDKGTGTPYGISSFSYDTSNYTATVRFDNDANSATPLVVPDQLVIKVKDDVTDVAGNKLDGEWVNPTSVDPSVSQPALHGFNSGNGAVGGDFTFRVTLLPGDPDLTDFGIVKDHFGATGAAATWENGNCDGQPDSTGATDVDLTDFGHLKTNFGIDYVDW